MKGRTIRRMNLGGKKYAKGDPVELPDDQFASLEAVGFVVPDKPDDCQPATTPPDRERAFTTRSKK